jgi:hypothetical protein
MEVEDFFEAEVAAAVAATAALFSPRVRHVLHRGAVYGVAGVLKAGDAVAGFARGVGQSVQQPTNKAPAGPVPVEKPATQPGRTHEPTTHSIERVPTE